MMDLGKYDTITLSFGLISSESLEVFEERSSEKIMDKKINP